MPPLVFFEPLLSAKNIPDTTIHAINKITAKIIKGDVYHAPPPPFFPLFGATAIAKEGNGGGGEIGAYADVNQEHYY